jgi:UDP-glucose 4-epimerase
VSAIRSVLVTGGTGFIGQHVVRRLVQDRHMVTTLQRSGWRPVGVRDLLRASEMTPASLRDLLRGRSFDWVIHLAAAGTHPAERDVETLFRVNVDVARALTELSATWPARAMFVAGSGAEYAPGVDRTPRVESSPLEAHRLYPASKAAGTLVAVAIASAAKLPLAVGRLFGVYGPGEAPHRLLPSLMAGLQAGKRVPLSMGKQERDFIYVEDVVDAIVEILHSLERSPKALIMNIASGHANSVRSFAETTADVLGADRALLGFGDLSTRPDEVPYFCGDPSMVYAYTGWKPRQDLRAGIARAVEALKRAPRS